MAELHYVDWDGLVYYDGKIKGYIEDIIHDCLKMGGIVKAQELPRPSIETLNYIYKVSDELLTSEDFELPGYEYPAGTWVQVASFEGVHKYIIFNEEAIGGTANLANYYTKKQTEDLINNSLAALEIDALKETVDDNRTDIGELQNSVTTLQTEIDEIETLVQDLNKENFVTDNELTELLGDYITDDELDAKGYITEHQDISGKADINHTHNLSDITDYSAPDFTGYATEEFVNKKIAEAELADKEADLEAYYTKSEVNALIPDVSGFISEIPSEYITESELNEKGYLTEHQSLAEYAKLTDIPKVPDNISAFNNDAQYTTLDEVASQGYLTEHQDLSEYAKSADVDRDFEIIRTQLITKTSQLENDSGYLTEATLPDFVQHNEIEDLVTLSEVAEAGFIKSVPEEYVTATELADRQFITEESLSQKGFITDVSDKADKDHTHSYNDLTDLPAIPSIEGLATEEYVNQAIADIDIPEAIDTSKFITNEGLATALKGKANDVPFTQDYRVGTPLGGFILDDSLQNMTIQAILTKLLGLTLYVKPEVPEGSSESIQEIISNESTIYSQDANGNLIETPFAYTTWTPKEAADQNEGLNTFYQIINEDGSVAESGYQEVTEYNEEAWLTVALPDTITAVKVKMYDPDVQDWVETNFPLELTGEHTTEGYNVWAVPELYQVMSGDTFRFVIVE